MKLIKVKGIVVKEVTYGDNDKIITLLTDDIGLVSCLAKGAKRTKSALLASSQYLVYSEFILFKGTSFYHVNSAEVINTFYSVRTDFDKLQLLYTLTKDITYLTNENIDTNQILRIFLNTLHFISEGKKNTLQLINIFRIKMITLLGFAPSIEKCSICLNKIDSEEIYYDYVSNVFLCGKCNLSKSSRQIKLELPCYIYISYIIKLSIEKIFTISINDRYIKMLDNFGEALVSCVKNGT